jgi:hypothetical protein
MELFYHGPGILPKHFPFDLWAQRPTFSRAGTATRITRKNFHSVVARLPGLDKHSRIFAGQARLNDEV